jgi:hypothetical protein
MALLGRRVLKPGKLQYNILSGSVEFIEDLRQKHMKLLPRALRVYLDAMRACDPSNPNTPDHAIRLKAADSFCDRFGLPKRSELTGDRGAPLVQQMSDEDLDKRLHELLSVYMPHTTPHTTPLLSEATDAE